MHRPTNRRPADMRPAHKTVFVCLMLTASGAAVVSSDAAGIRWLPAWIGAAIAFAALLGMLLVLQRIGALRMRLLVLFVTALAAAALCGHLSTAHG